MVKSIKQQLFFLAPIVACIISYLFRESRLIITTAFKRQSVKYANSNELSSGTCQNKADPSNNSLLYHQRDIRKYQDKTNE
ncbi:MAG: hypothetical protein WA631_10610 [Nitrososphaeraceae archaeon]